MSFISKCNAFRQQTQGFSLIEMAIVLSIIGVIIGFSLPLLVTQKSQDRQRITRKNQDFVLHALGTYSARENAILCPALKPDGMASLNCGRNNLGTCVGYIPYKSIGIPEEFTKDGYGHPMRYAIQPGLIGPAQFCVEKKGELDPTAQLRVLDPQGHLVVNKQSKDFVAVLLLSEGAAYKNPQGSYEVQNTQQNLIFHAKPLNMKGDQPFRHIVAWASRDTLVNYYGQSSCRVLRSAQEPSQTSNR